MSCSTELGTDWPLVVHPMSAAVKTPSRPWWMSVLLLLVAFGLCSGCKTTDDDLVERPWNAPKSWETGLPAGMLEGR